MTTLRETLLNQAKDYCQVANISLSRLSNIVMKDGKFFERLQKKGGCTIDSYEKFMAWFESEEAVSRLEKKKRKIVE